MASFIPYVLALVLAVQSANAIKCYSCTSEESTTCKWGLTSFAFKTEECTSVGLLEGIGAGAKCFKMSAKNKDGDEYVARGCLPPPAVGCSAIAKTVGWLSSPTQMQDIQCETCDTDKCNSASRIAGFTLLGILLAAFAFLF